MEILFEEIQGSGKKSTRDFLRVITGLFLVALAYNLIKQRGSINELTTGFFIGFVICIIASIFASTRMVTQIRNDGIYVSFPPFQPSFDKYLWSNIQELYIRKFDAVSEFKGWGIKSGPAGKGYIISGDTGIQIVLRDSSRILISTQQPGQIADTLKRLNRFQ